MHNSNNKRKDFNQEVKKNIIKAVSFLLIVVVLIIVLSYIFLPKNNTEEAGMYNVEANGILAEKENQIDLLILGDSEPFTSITPMQLWNDYGFTGYECCSLQQTMPESFWYLNKALKKQHPKIIIIEANNIYTASQRKEHLEGIINNKIPIFGFHNRWKRLKKEDFTEKVNYDTVNDLKGYRYTTDSVEAKDREIMKPTEDMNIIPRSNVIYIKWLNNYCSENGIKLLILRTPTRYSWEYKSYLGVKQLCDKEKIEYIDMNMIEDRVNIDWTKDSKDGGDHLNHFGAIKTTKFLGKFLSEKNILPDHRNDPNYNNWHDSYKKYQEICH